MSQENAELVRRGYDAFARGDRQVLMDELFDPEVEWFPALGPLLEQSSYRGPEAVCHMLFEEIPSVLQGFRAEVLEVRDLGDEAVLAIVRFRGFATAGVEVEQLFFQVHWLREGKALVMRSYTSEAAALEAAGLRE